MIFDPMFLIDVLRGAAEVLGLIEEVDASGTTFASAVTVMQRHEGIYLAQATEEERARVTELLTGINELPFDRECAVRAGEINADLVSAGEEIDETDVRIAPPAIVHDSTVVTRYVDQIERIEWPTSSRTDRDGPHETEPLLVVATVSRP